MNVRKMRRGDVRKIEELEKEAFTVGPYDYKMLLLSYKMSQGMSIVVEEGDRIIGYGIAIPVDSKDADIESIGIHPHFQGKGIGKLIMQNLEDMMRKRGFEKSILEVREKNIPALRLYKKMGYETSEFIENYYEEFFEGSRNAFRMIKYL